MRACIFLLGSLPLFAQQSQDAAEALAHARELVRTVIAQLPKYTCSATVNRSYYKETRRLGRTCDDIVANRNLGRAGLQKTATDRLRFDVEIADGGYAIFSWPGAGRIDSERIEDLANGGPIGTGPFGPFLIDIFANDGARFDSHGHKLVDGQDLLEYRFRVPLKASHYKVGVGASIRFVAYDGRFWIDPVSARLARLEVRTGELPPIMESCEATTTVNFQTARIGEGEYLIPRQSQLQVIGKYGDDSDSETTYSACHEFRGESTVQFGEATPEAAFTNMAAARQAGALPPGLPVSLAFETQIDTDVAAAGDPLVARVTRSVIDPRSKGTLLPAGTKVNGRIVHLEHHLEGKDYFLLSVRFESLPLILDNPRQIVDPDKPTPCWGSVKQIESKGRLSQGATFVLPSKNGRFVTPLGCESRWLTAPVP